MTSPYAPPSAASDARPGVIRWFRVFAATSALAYAGVAALLALRVTTHTYYPPEIPVAFVELAMALGAALAGVLSGVAAFAPFRPWGWSLALVVLGIGAVGPMLFVAAPLLFLWTKPAVKAAFGRLP